MLSTLFMPGRRTYILSMVVLVLALLLQADSQGLFTLAPILKLVVTMVLTITVPLVPVFIRKALPKDYLGKK